MPEIGELTQSCAARGEAGQERVSRGTRGVTQLRGCGLQVTPGASEEQGGCFLTETDNSCKVCCRDEQDRCIPYVDANDQFLFLRKGKPCTVGFCDANVSFPRGQCPACSASVAGCLRVLGDKDRAGKEKPKLLGRVVLCKYLCTGSVSKGV